MPIVSHNAVGIVKTSAWEASDEYVARGDSDGDDQADDWLRIEETVTIVWFDTFATAEAVPKNIPDGMAEGVIAQLQVGWCVIRCIVLV